MSSSRRNFFHDAMLFTQAYSASARDWTRPLHLKPPTRILRTARQQIPRPKPPSPCLRQMSPIVPSNSMGP